MKPKGVKKQKDDKLFNDSHEQNVYPRLSELFEGLQKIEDEFQNENNTQKTKSISKKSGSHKSKTSSLSDVSTDNQLLDIDGFRGLSIMDLQNDVISGSTIPNSSSSRRSGSVETDYLKSRSTSDQSQNSDASRDLSLTDLQIDSVSEESFEFKKTVTAFDRIKCNASARGEHCDFQEWISWRTQANGQLVYLIQRNSGYTPNIAPWEASRHALSSNTMNSVIEHARGSAPPGSSTLLGKPYIMYGIPRAHVCSKGA